jgi:hypothetical protein
MTKRILSVGFEFPGGVVEYVPIKSGRSLLDADIIVFAPKMEHEYYSYDNYQGKPLLSDDDSFKANEHAAHWRSELKAAFNAGRTIIVYLTKLEEYYVHTGEKQYSGTGRSRSVTNIVAPFNNYSCLPISADRVVASHGTEIRVAKDLKFLGPYWKDLAEYSFYEVYLEGKFKDVIFTTKGGDRIIGAVIVGQKGTMILLPPIKADLDEFFRCDEKKETEFWTKKGIEFGKLLLGHIVEIDRVIKSYRELTPAPEWTKVAGYRLEREAILEKEIKAITSKIGEMQDTRSQLNVELEEEGKIRWLLYEKGRMLEEAVLYALRIMGFKAEPFKDSESEFDCVFTSPEGRFLGEAEGKDNAAINIDKLSQLERNIGEDFARDEVKEHAHGVLFGNAYRLKEPFERADFFTEKCVSGAKRTGIALVRTPDLFMTTKYLKEHKDERYAQKCREAIFNAKGSVVTFPEIPEEQKQGEVLSVEEKK